MTRTDDSKMWVRGIGQESSPHDETSVAPHTMSRPDGVVDKTDDGSSYRRGHLSATEQADSGLGSLGIISSEFTRSGNLTSFDMTHYDWEAQSEEDDIEVDCEYVHSVTNAFGTLNIGDKDRSSFQNMNVMEPLSKRFCEGVSHRGNFQRDNTDVVSRDKRELTTMEDTADSGNYHSFELPSAESTVGSIENDNVAHTVANENGLTKEQVVELYATCNKDGDNHLHASIINGNISVALFLIHLAPECGWLNFSNLLRQTALHLAVITNQPTIVQRLVSAGASLEVQDKNGDTPLSIACKMGSSEIVRDLLDIVTNSGVANGAFSSINFNQGVNMRNFEGLTPLHVAVMAGHVTIVKRLLFAGADPNAEDSRSGRTPLHFAADLGNEEMVQLLAGHRKTKVDFRDYSDYSAAHLAYGRGYVRIVEILVRKYNESVQNLELAFVEDSDDDD